MEVCRPWDPATEARVTARVPVLTPGVLADQTLDQSPQAGLIEMTGHWTHFECVIDVPESWLDLTCRCVRTVGGVDTVVAIRTVATLQNPIVTGGRVGGVLFSIRGRPGDRFRVEAWRTRVDHAEGKIYARAWGADDGLFGDEATRLPIDLWAGLDNERSFTTGEAGLAVGVTQIFAATGIPRARIAITDLTWFRSDAAVGTIVLREQPGAVVRWVLRNAQETAAKPGYVQEDWHSHPLVSSVPGGSWEVTLDAGAVGANILNVKGFNV